MSAITAIGALRATCSCRKQSGSRRKFAVTHFVPHNLPALRLRAALWPACTARCGSSETTPLLVESAGSETPQVVTSFPGQIGMRVCTCEICHRRAYACVHWGQENRVD